MLEEISTLKRVIQKQAEDFGTNQLHAESLQRHYKQQLDSLLSYEQ